jgi:hypothetical protein
VALQTMQERVDVAVMMAQRGGGDDVFGMAERFIRDRRRADERRRKAGNAPSPMQVARILHLDASIMCCMPCCGLTAHEASPFAQSVVYGCVSLLRARNAVAVCRP